LNDGKRVEWSYQKNYLLWIFSWTSIAIEVTGETKPYTGNFASAFANKSTIVIRTLAKWNSCGSKPAALLFRENTCHCAAHKGITHCYYHVALVARNISKWTGCRTQIFCFCSTLAVSEMTFSNWEYCTSYIISLNSCC